MIQRSTPVHRCKGGIAKRASSERFQNLSSDAVPGVQMADHKRTTSCDGEGGGGGGGGAATLDPLCPMDQHWHPSIVGMQSPAPTLTTLAFRHIFPSAWLGLCNAYAYAYAYAMLCTNIIGIHGQAMMTDIAFSGNAAKRQ